MGSIRRECLDHMIIFSIAGLRRVLADDVEYRGISTMRPAERRDRVVTLVRPSREFPGHPGAVRTRINW